MESLKKFTVERYYTNSHPTYIDLKSEEIKSNFTKLKQEFSKQYKLFFKNHDATIDEISKVSYELSRMIAINSKPFNNSNFIKDCLTVTAIFCLHNL